MEESHIRARIVRQGGAYGFVLTIALLLLVMCWPTLRWLAERFAAPASFYSHGWLIPLASAWLVWRRRGSLRSASRQPSWWGMSVLVPALFVHALATTWRIGFLAGFAMLGIFWGLVWTWWGTETVQRLRFPLLFLLFMVPLPDVLLLAVSFKMKLLAARAAAGLLTAAGVATQQAGSTLHLPGLNIVVDDTCSGLRSLISLLALSTLWLAFLPPQAGRWQRLLVVAAAVPIALVANMVRIVVLSLIALRWGAATAEGFVHVGSGLVVFGVALLALSWVSHGIQRWSSSSAAPV